MDQAAGEGGREEGEEEHIEQQSQRIQVATARTLDLGAVGEIYRGDILGPPPHHQHHHHTTREELFKYTSRLVPEKVAARKI